ncbi:MAG TPA: GNAT family N-acetyltransferase [Albitalea sp.]|uniref:GNAT family N-acetyltransferase n=1 Tax=Piscinibacter sp. TaxID=1903157 RepID=UPI002ED5C53E
MTTTDPRPPTAAPTTPPASFAGWAWVPIRSLSARHRPRIAAHLLDLDEHDRYLRFGYPATDEQVARYVDTLDFERDEVLGIFNRRLELIAMAHVAYAPMAQQANPRAMAEFGVSVRATARGRGFGARLFEHAVLHARNRGIETLFIHALSENTAMLKIARQAGGTIERSGSEAEAWVKLPPDTLVTRFGEMVETQAAEFDYQLKRHAHRVNEILESFAEVKNHLNRKASAASE